MKEIDVLLVGRGPFADEIAKRLPKVAKKNNCETEICRWPEEPTNSIDFEQSVLVFASSPKNFQAAIQLCQKYGIPMIQAATQLDYTILPDPLDFAFVDAPNLAIPIVKLLYMLRSKGVLFEDYNISILESHQESKSTQSGTAIEFANRLNMKDPKRIFALRDPMIQKTLLGIPDKYLNGHAFHQIDIRGEGVELSFTTKIYGRDAYVFGIAKVIEQIHILSHGKYHITNLIEDGII